MLSGTLAKQRVHDLGLVEAVQQKRKVDSGKVVQRYREIYIDTRLGRILRLMMRIKGG